jgi:hypothetical protein
MVNLHRCRRVQFIGMRIKTATSSGLPWARLLVLDDRIQVVSPFRNTIEQLKSTSRSVYVRKVRFGFLVYQNIICLQSENGLHSLGFMAIRYKSLKQVLLRLEWLVVEVKTGLSVNEFSKMVGIELK